MAVHSSSSLSAEARTGAGLLDVDATGRRGTCSSRWAASAASIHSEYISIGSVRSGSECSIRQKWKNLNGSSLRLTLLWYLWSHTLHTSCATPSFLSSFTVTDLSWWQNRQVKVLSIWKQLSYQTCVDWGILGSHREEPSVGQDPVFWKTFCACPWFYLK